MFGKKHKKSRDVTLNDIVTISSDMTHCINTQPVEIYPLECSQHDDPGKNTYNYSNSATPPLSTINNVQGAPNRCTPIMSTLDTIDVGIDKNIPIYDSKTDDSIIGGKEQESYTSGSSQGRTSQLYRNRQKKKKHKRFYTYPQETSDNANRNELLWSTKIEDVIKGWHSRCLEFAEVHGIQSKYHKKVFYCLGIPAAIIPMSLAAASDILNDEWKVVAVFSLIVTGILNTIMGFKNPGKRAEAHLNFEALYSELAIEITSELVKPQAFRQDADVFIQRIMDRYNSLNNRAPQT